jgi:hypothetical protein
MLKLIAAVMILALVGVGTFFLGRATSSSGESGACRTYVSGDDSAFLCTKGKFPKSSACSPAANVPGGVLWTHCNPEAERQAAERRHAKLQEEATASGFKTVSALLNYQGCLQVYQPSNLTLSAEAWDAAIERHCAAKWKGH